MQQFTVSSQEEGQRLMRYLEKYMPGAPKSFFYRMLRKKNITLNKKKADGNERLQMGDQILLFLSKETIDSFAKSTRGKGKDDGRRRRKPPASIPVLFENEHVLLVSKPSGILSQPDGSNVYSVVDFLSTKIASTNGFSPGICNRLDRNTSGLTVCGKSVRSLRDLSRAFAGHTLEKYYLCVAQGRITEKEVQNAWLTKDGKANRSVIHTDFCPGAAKIRTAWMPLMFRRGKTLLLVRLYTGRPHQIRAGLSFAGHPLAGDQKYGGDVLLPDVYGSRKGEGNRQLLHCAGLVFPKELQRVYGLPGLCSCPVPDPFFLLFPELASEDIKEVIARGHMEFPGA